MQKNTIFATAFNKECKDITLNSCTITSALLRADKCYWSSARSGRRFPYRHLWFVVNRAAFGESLRLFAFV